MSIELEALIKLAREDGMPDELVKHMESAYRYGKNAGYRERQQEIESSMLEIFPDLNVRGEERA